MATKPSIKVPTPRRTVSVQLLAPDVVELSFRGNVSDRSVEYARELLMPLSGVRHFLLDASATESFDESIRVPGVLLLRELRARGVERGVAVTNLPVRIIGSALSFVAALPVDFVRTREQALARIAELRKSG